VGCGVLADTGGTWPIDNLDMKNKQTQILDVRHLPTVSCASLTLHSIHDSQVMSAEPPEDAKPKLNLVISLLEARMFSPSDGLRSLFNNTCP
jgi:hypothetical protein